MKNFKIIYFFIGGAIILITAVIFLWVVLSGVIPSLLQWFAAGLLMIIGGIFMGVGNESLQK